MNDKQYAADLKVMIAADKKHLEEAAARGERVNARNHLDSLIDNQRELEDLNR